MSAETQNSPPAEEPSPQISKADKPFWLTATVDDLRRTNFELPIVGSTAADAGELGDLFESVLPRPEVRSEIRDTPPVRVFAMLAAVAGMYFRPENPNEPFGPMMTLADGRRSPAPEDFRGEPIDVLATASETATNAVLRARLCDVSWILDRKRAGLGGSALASYVEVVRQIKAGEIKHRYNHNGGVLTHDVRDYVRRALQIGRSIGWEKAETLAARKLATDLRLLATKGNEPVPAYWFSELDLDFHLSDPSDVATSIDDFIKTLKVEESIHTAVDLCRLAARAYRAAKKDAEAARCRAVAAERLVAEADRVLSKQNSAFLASIHLSAAIAELHGIADKKELRLKLRHRLVDVQVRIPDELSSFSHKMDLSELIKQVETTITPLGLLDKLFAFAALTQSPEPEVLIEQAREQIAQHPLSSIFGATHHDSEGKVIHRTEGGLSPGDASDPAIQTQVAQAEAIRRHITSAEIDVARQIITDQHYISDDPFGALLPYSAFVPQDLITTFAHGFASFFRGDFVSATYILTPLLENSLRHVLKAHGHDVTIFDDATQTQQDRTISSLFEQMRTELDAIFGVSITTDIENLFLRRPGPTLRHSVAHGLLHDHDPYGPDALYGCWLIFRLCLLPLFHYRDRLKLPAKLS